MNMQAGSLYAHIDSKEDVLWEIVNRAAEQFLEAAEPIAASRMSPPEKLRELVRSHVRMVSANLAEATIFLHEWKFLGQERRDLINERRNRYEGLYRQVVEEGIASGDFSSTDPKMATVLVLSAVNWLPQWYNPAGPLSADEIAASFSDLVLRGLEPRPEPAATDDQPPTTGK
jgi:AcrR family transcriptional regulator